MPRPSVRRPALLVAVVLALAVAPSCTGGQRQPSEYGADYEANFMLGCTGEYPDGSVPNGYESLGSQDYCECVYDGLVKKVPFDEVKTFEDEQANAEAGEIEVPTEIAAVFDDCEPKR
jgi:hypothetical protein